MKIKLSEVLNINNLLKTIIDNNNVKIDPLMHIAAQDFHIIDFNRNMHSIVSREFGNQFLDVMAYPRFLNKIKQNHKLW